MNFLTECCCQVENRRCKITQTQRSILSHVFQHDYWHNFWAQLKTDIIKSITQSFCPQYAGFFFWIHFKYALPCFQISYERFKLQEIDATMSGFLKSQLSVGFAMQLERNQNWKNNSMKGNCWKKFLNFFFENTKFLHLKYLRLAAIRLDGKYQCLHSFWCNHSADMHRAVLAIQNY